MSTGSPLGVQQPLAADLPECPYVGLIPFDAAQAVFFFGRERECDLVIANLTAARLTLLYAASGVGKSSLLRAGVLPRVADLNAETYRDLGTAGVAAAYVNEWSGDAGVRVAAAVLAAVAQVPGAQAPEDLAVGTFSAEWLAEVIDRTGLEAVYLVLDQFEEYFLYHGDDDALLRGLSGVLSVRTLPVNVLLSVREDALATLDRLKGRLPHLFENYLRLEALDARAARSAVEGPLVRYNELAPAGSAMELEDGLVEAILEEVRLGAIDERSEESAPAAADARSGGDGELRVEAPYLQLVLIRLWDEERAGGSGTIRTETLQRLGGARTIVRRHLDMVMAELSQEEQDVAADTFHLLVTPSGSKIALTAADLASWSGQPVTSVESLLGLLSTGRRRILRPVPPPVGTAGPPRFEIFHDVLGPAVLDWRRRYVARRQQLLDERRLVEERNRAEETAAATRRKLRRIRLLAAAMAVVLVGMSGLTWYAALRNREAQQNSLLAEAAASLSSAPGQSLRLAVAAYRISADAEAREAVLAAASVPSSEILVRGRPTVVQVLTSRDAERIAVARRDGSVLVFDGDGQELALSAAITDAGRVAYARMNPEGTHLALTTTDGQVFAVDVDSGTSLRVATDARVAPQEIGTSPTGTYVVVTFAAGGGPRLVDAATGEELLTLPNPAWEAVPTPDGQHVVTADEDGRLRVWDTRTGELTTETTEVVSASYVTASEDAVLALSGRVPGTVNSGLVPSIVVWNWRARPEPLTFPSWGAFRELWSLRRVESGHLLLALDKSVWVYTPTTEGPWTPGGLPGHPDWVFDADLDAQGRWFATAGADGRVLVWSGYNTTAPTYELRDHQGPVLGARFVRDASALVSYGVDGTVRLWQLPEVERLDSHGDWVLGLDASPDGAWLLSAGRDRVVISDRERLQEVASVHVGVAGNHARFDPRDPSRVYLLPRFAAGLAVYRWNEDGGTEAVTTGLAAPGGDDLVLFFDVSADGELLVTGTWDARVAVWDPDSGEEIAVLDADVGDVHDVAVDPGGAFVVIAAEDGKFRWNPTSDELVELPDPRGPATGAGSVAIAAEGNLIAGTAPGGMVDLWAADGEHIGEVEILGETTGQPSFSADGRYLAVGTAEGLAQVVDLDDHRTISRFRVNGDTVNDILWNVRNGRTSLLTASDDFTVTRSPCEACDDAQQVIDDAVTRVESSEDG